MKRFSVCFYDYHQPLSNFRSPYRIILFIICLIFADHSSSLLAQTNDTVSKILSQIDFNARISKPFNSYRDDILSSMIDISEARQTKLASSFHLRYGFTFNPHSKEGSFYPGVYQGAGISINDFGNRKGLGLPINIYLFQGAPVWRISRKVTLDYEWNFGLSTGWHPSDGHSGKSNLIVGSKVNAYINASLLMSWFITPHLKLTAGIDATHFSNGNTSFPNPGVNMTGARIGATWLINNVEASPAVKADTTGIKGKKITYDITAYGAWRRRVYRGGETPVLLNGHFSVAGVDFAPMFEVCPIFRAGVSADFQWDRSTDLKRHHLQGSEADDITFSRPNFFSQICAGVSARAELVMPIFSINAGIGYNVAGPPETRGTNQLANLKVYLTSGLFLNIGYQLLNFSTQNNLMLGIGYTVGSRRNQGARAIF